MKKLIAFLLFLLGAHFALAGQTDAPTTFLPHQDAMKKQKEGSFSPGTLYYWNRVDDPSGEPEAGTDGNKNFIRIQGLEGDSITIANSICHLARFSKIPPNPPKNITVSFDVKAEMTPIDPWTDPDLLNNVKSNPTFVTIQFLKAGEIGGGTNIKLNPGKGWEKISKTILVPSDAQFLVLHAACKKGDSIAIANWTIQ